MSLIKPFVALCPAPGRAADVAAPPYDVMSADEARRMALGRPWSFLHVSRPEIDLPKDVDPYSSLVYAKGRENFMRMLASGILKRDPGPCYRVYRLTQGAHRQTGLVAVVSLDAYARERIKRHELTRPIKEDDRVRQIEALDAQTGPVLLACRARPEIESLLARLSASSPDIDILADDGVRHELWSIFDPETIAELTLAFDRLDALYIADGHHRCAAAARVAAARQSAAAGLISSNDPAVTPDESVAGAGATKADGAAAESTPAKESGEDASAYGLSVIFPHSQLRILDYNRLVKDLHGHSLDAFMNRLAVSFRLEGALGPVRPQRPGEFGMYVAGHWYRMTIDPERIPHDDPVARLDVSLLQDQVISPILGVADPRRDDRIDFVGGSRSLESLAARVDAGEMAVAFSLYPTRIEDLMAVADAGEVMPPKSTWFEPKLADGLVSHPLNDDLRPSW